MHLAVVAVLEGLLFRYVPNLGHQVRLTSAVQLPQFLPLQPLVKDQLPFQSLERSIGHEMLGGVGVVSGWRIHNIEGQPQSLVQHLRHNPGKQRTAEFQTGVGVDLDEPWVEVPINHKIQPKNLKIMFLPLR